ncbi:MULTISPECIES: LysR family transcriptional regulator [unclassified Providencia]|uniref:LysR family transcriptional regulator n=1 Tax=unclassified Providencia TaxID=2633465 RepID=UPI000E95A990|nr:LysR family transcriptional regulator [Providencia sp.]MBP6081049.1 LysR family transcriptional regulator [Providencia sp.]HBO23385.1 LysR family transcriptional regulator [Providencia sp.]
MPQKIDFNLIYALNLLLEEGSVGGAAEKMNLSAPAMSRILGRIREQFNDPIMVRAGRKLVPTPRALELKQQLSSLIAQAEALIEPNEAFNPLRLERTFTIRANDIFIGALGGGLLEGLREKAPLSSLKFIAESDIDDDGLRSGKVDLVIGSSQNWHPEIKAQSLFTSTFQALVRQGHPIIGQVTPESLTHYPHISVSRRGLTQGPIDDALRDLGLQRNVALTLPGFHSAMMLTMKSDYILPLPRHVLQGVKSINLPLVEIDLPLELESVFIVQAWHPRLDRDSAHQWLRQTIKQFFLKRE